VSTIQGNFLSKEVQAEVKRFLNDPNRGRLKQQLYLASTGGPYLSTPDSVLFQESYIDMERQADAHNNLDDEITTGKKSRRQLEDAGKTVDVVLSDMSAPWEQTSGFWKRSLNVPYIRMMNTSGIPFRDHAGSMVSFKTSLKNASHF
jgi:21S rRNA (uridine2791-2'-O)-methyltransferase